MSDRGSILISTANDIGEALVEKLGGEGYAPAVWDKEYNKLGIAEVDSAPALSVLEDSSETGTARGSILLSTANKIGAMLNKKYNTDRGFKPKEWASAASKLAPLPEKSAESASICSIEDGADDVPSRSLVVTIPPTLTGISEVVETQTGKNLFILPENSFSISDMNFSVENESLIISGQTAGGGISSKNQAYKDNFSFGLPAGTYYFTRGTWNKAVYLYDLSDDSTALVTNSGSFTLSKYTVIYIGFYIGANLTITDTTFDGYLVQGSTASSYSSQWSRKYTADLGRTINGGTADIVNGVGTETHKDIDLGSLNWQYDSANTRFFTVDLTSVIKRGTSGWITDLAVSSPYTVASGTANDKTVSEYATTGYVYIKDTDFTDPALFKTSLSGKYLAYPLATPESFTFDGQDIPTKDGYNAFWSDQGNTALDYYGEPEPYTRGTASGAIANVQSARTDLPFTQVKANIAPNLTGVESVEVTKLGKNLCELSNETYGNSQSCNYTYENNGITIEATGTYARVGFIIPLKKGTSYTLSYKGKSTSAYRRVTLYRETLWTGAIGAQTLTDTEETYTYTFTAENDHICIGFYVTAGTSDGITNISDVQIEVGSSATEYTPYEEPTVYTADLGEPVYGGYAEIVNGEGVKTFGIVDLGTLNYTLRSNVGMQSNGVSSLIKNPPDNYTKTDAIAEGYTADTWQAVVNGGTSSGLFGVSGGYICFSTTETDADTFKTSMSGKYLVYPLATPEDFSFNGQVISPSEGVNNLWNNAGGDTDVEYYAQE